MGPLAGIKIIELGGIGPAPMCCMLLADLGASVLRIERTSAADLGTDRPLAYQLVYRNREAIALDLKDPQAIALVQRLVASADALIEPFRPGVLERLGLSPASLRQHNARLVVGRMTGWGQTGPLAHAAGHDINYIALSGILNAIGRKGQPPTPPLNLIGDYAGGALYLALGLLAGIIEARQSGLGQDIDAAMYEGAVNLSTLFYGINAAGTWDKERGNNYLDSGAPWYDVLPCGDGKLLSVAPIEERFWREFLRVLELDPAALPDRHKPSNWPALREVFCRRLASRTRDDWLRAFGDAEACVAPVLDFDEAPLHPHAVARGTFITIDGVEQPAPQPRFSRSVPPAPHGPRPADNADPATSLSDWLSPAEVAAWRGRGLLQTITGKTQR